MTRSLLPIEPYFNTAVQLATERVARSLVMRTTTADFALVYAGHVNPRASSATFAWAWLEYTREATGAWVLTNASGTAWWNVTGIAEVSHA